MIISFTTVRGVHVAINLAVVDVVEYYQSASSVVVSVVLRGHDQPLPYQVELETAERIVREWRFVLEKKV